MPVGWVRVALGEVCETTSGGTPTRGRYDYYNGSILWVKSGELNYNIITQTEEKISEKGLQNSSAKLLPQGTLLIALYGATVGRLAILGVEAATNQAVCAILVPPSINHKYLYHFLFSSKETLLQQRTGGAQPNISQAIVNNLPIPLPPLAEQNRIVARLEMLLKELNETEAALQQAKSQAEEYRQAVLRDAFEGRLTNEVMQESEFPKEWKQVTVSEVSTKIQYGFTARAKNENTGIKILRITDIQNGEVNWDEVPYTDIEAILKEEYLLREDDILFARSGNTVGKTFLVEGIIPAAVFASYLIRIVTDPRLISAKYLFYYFQTEEYWSKIRGGQTGVSQPNFNGKKLSDIELLLPPIEEQHLIVKRIEDIFLKTSQIHSEIKASLEKTQSLRQTLFKDAFAGKLVSQYSSDEPATQLLERIKLEKIRMAAEQKQHDKTNREAKRLKAQEPEVPKTIVQVLEEQGGTYPAAAVWRECEHKGDIEKFYAALKLLMNKEVTEDTEKRKLILIQ